MVVKKIRSKILGISIPGTAKARRYPWKIIKNAPDWVSHADHVRLEGQTQILTGKRYSYKVVGTSDTTLNHGHGTVKYYRRKRGYQ